MTKKIRSLTYSQSVAFHENFVICGNGPYVFSSKDGVTWAQRSVLHQLKGITNGADKWVAFSDTHLAVSTDGIQWNFTRITTELLPAWPKNAKPSFISFSDDRFLLRAQASQKETLYESQDGIIWVAAKSNKDKSITAQDEKCREFVKSLYINFCQTDSSEEPFTPQIQLHEGRFVAILDGSTRFYYSKDGQKWTSGFLPNAPYFAKEGPAQGPCQISSRKVMGA